MIFVLYALSFLSGILWVQLKLFSILIFTIILIIMYQKSIPLYHYLLILSFFFLALFQIHHTLKTNHLVLQNLKVHSNINSKVIFQNNIKQFNQLIKGQFLYNNNLYHFTFKSAYLKAEDLKNRECKINGNITNSIHNETYVYINQLDDKHCTKISHINFINKHLNYIKNKLYHSSLKCPERVLALIIGDTSAIDTEYLDTVKAIGIYHLLAVSGSHVATIIYIIHYSLVRFNIPKLFIRISIIIILILFIFYTNFAPSALRAVLTTITFFIIPKPFKTSSISVLSLVFLIMAIWNMNFVYDIGFQFSFIISFFILLSMPLFNNQSNLKNYIYITIIAQFSSMIISIYHFNQFQWIGFISNVIFVPLYSFIIFPLAIVLFTFYHIFNDLQLLNWIANHLFELHDKIMQLFILFRNYQITIADQSNLSLLCCFILLTLSTIFICYKRFKSFLIIIILFVLFIHLINQPLATTFTALNVGQGDSFLFQTKNNETVMVDTGGKVVQSNSKDNHNTSKYHIMPTLKSRGISQIDYLILTHPHNDHIGEFPYLVQNIRIKNLYLYTKSYSVEQIKTINTLCNMYHIKLIDVSKINNIQMKDSKISFLNAFIDSIEDKNAQSIISLIEYKNYKLLLMGDAIEENENLLLKKYHLPLIDVLKVGHHGSKTSSSKKFLKVIQPKISIISSGKNNSFHLPNNETIDKLEKINSHIYNTQTDGEITLNLDNQLISSLNRN
ncbi:competence protein ComEC [Staphylococcus hominis]